MEPAVKSCGHRAVDWLKLSEDYPNPTEYPHFAGSLWSAQKIIILLSFLAEKDQCNYQKLGPSSHLIPSSWPRPSHGRNCWVSLGIHLELSIQQNSWCIIGINRTGGVEQLLNRYFISDWRYVTDSTPFPHPNNDLSTPRIPI